MADISDNRGERRLNSWKEIAAFFGKDERTVKRWETSRGMPVRRVPGGTRTSVFAYAAELEAWLGGGNGHGQANGAADAAAGAGAARRARLLPDRSWWMFAAATVLAAIAALLLAPAGQPPVTATVQAERHIPPAAAQDLYLSGVYQLNTRTSDGLNRAAQDFSAAIAIDPDYAKAFAGLANAYNLLSQYTLMPAAEAYPKGKAAAERAVALDDALPEAYAALAFNEFYWGRNFTHSAELFETAVALDPTSAQIHHWYALTSMHMGAFERPVELITRAQELDPASRPILANKALIYFHAGRAEEAIAILAALKQEHPDYLATPSYLATIYLAQGRDEDFLREYEEAARVQNNPGRLAVAAAARRGLADGGGTGMLQAMLAEQEAQFANGGERAYKLAATAALLGDSALALEFLTTAVERGETDVLGMRIEPSFRGLHGNPAFGALLQKVGLPLP